MLGPLPCVKTLGCLSAAANSHLRSSGVVFVLVPAPSLGGIAAYLYFAATHRNPSLKPDAPAALRHRRAL